MQILLFSFSGRKYQSFRKLREKDEVLCVTRIEKFFFSLFDYMSSLETTGMEMGADMASETMNPIIIEII